LNLKPFQLEGAAFLAARTRALLADEPGVGKTGQLIQACQQIGAKHIRVVCPGVGIEHWRREFKRWWTDVKRPVLEILSYDDARRMTRNAMKVHGRVNVLIADECHFAKNPTAQRTAAIFDKNGLAWYADHIWCASGTPAPNNASELWPMLRAYGATSMDYESFKRYFCVVDDR
jgi:SWI/SNF-related matrix-associated actin-dependent regulator 1 of chromatin subfamily A